MPRRYEYILGASPFEVRRLAFQASVWNPMTEALFDRLKVGPGWRVLDAGAGTGTVLFPLAKRVLPGGGRVDAIERSPEFAGHLRRMLRGSGMDKVRVFESDILDAPLEHGAYDLIFARWVFSFLPRVEEHLYHLLHALKPGGLLAIEDYYRDSLAMFPRTESWEWMVKAERLWYGMHGGDLNVAAKLPDMFRRAGLQLVEVTPHIKVGGPDSDVWKWAENFFIGRLKDMARYAPFTPERARQFRKDWLRAKRNPGALFVSPVILDVVGRRPASRR